MGTKRDQRNLVCYLGRWVTIDHNEMEESILSVYVLKKTLCHYNLCIGV